MPQREKEREREDTSREEEEGNQLSLDIAVKERSVGVWWHWPLASAISMWMPPMSAHTYWALFPPRSGQV